MSKEKSSYISNRFIAKKILKNIDYYCRVEFALKNNTQAYALPTTYKESVEDMIKIVTEILEEQQKLLKDELMF